VSLDQTPSYEAISYTWGGQKPEIDIIIDDKHSLVTPSVFEIIRYRQSFFSDTYLWIDAVCINQSSRDDKNQQIALMRNIYQQSTRVIIWLGPRQSVKNSFDTFRMLIHLSFRASYGINQPFPTTLNASDPKWVSVMQMFSHPWFERSWIIQEVVASK
ncbi:heterokaryon incompatibility, partial [Tricladium varicosporioides]